jgi:hypothetical protein
MLKVNLLNQIFFKATLRKSFNNFYSKNNLVMKAIDTGFTVETTTKQRKNKTHINKWDKYLDDYKNYFKEYQKYYKNAQNGDQVALSQYPYMRAKWEILKERIIKAQGNNCLTKKQIGRMGDINMKIVNSSF